MTTADLKALIQSEISVPNTSQHLYHNGRLLNDDTKSLETLRIRDGEMLAMHVRDTVGQTGVSASGSRSIGSRQNRGMPQTQRGQGQGSVSRDGGQGGPDPEMMRLKLLGDPRMRAEVRGQNPELADAVENPERFQEVWYALQRQQAEAERTKQREIAMLNEDPFNAEAQAKIEEIIRQEAVTENLQNALEHNPEAFGKVHMLYIDVQVNGHNVKAFVDSGAQVTIMSPSCAETCGIMRLVDKRFAGIAKGVGTANILGRVHSAQIKIGSVFLACSFTVMEGKDVDLLLGLDMLKRHQACIDLRKGKLVIADAEVPFLGEADIPKSSEALTDEPTVEGPAGTRVGAKSGAIIAPEGSAAAQGVQTPGNFSGAGQTLGASSQKAPGQQAQPAAPRSQVSVPAQPSANTPAYPAEAIDQLQQLGFSRQEAIAALDATGGNVDYAAGLLFQG
ncbi:MAG: DNA damage-inducible protein 1 [Pycnora praestabilis]|nr:MAG: DNA damage-inducible protein 1 [Pycnora praestabilis]